MASQRLSLSLQEFWRNGHPWWLVCHLNETELGFLYPWNWIIVQLMLHSTQDFKPQYLKIIVILTLHDPMSIRLLTHSVPKSNTWQMKFCVLFASNVKQKLIFSNRHIYSSHSTKMVQLRQKLFKPLILKSMKLYT